MFGPNASGAVHLIRILPPVCSDSAYRARPKPVTWGIQYNIAGLILGQCPTNKRRRYKVTPSLIGWAQT